MAVRNNVFFLSDLQVLSVKIVPFPGILSPPDSHMTCSLTSFRSLFKYHFPREAFSNHSG